ncbi:3-oxoacyl-ACP reductase FabG [Patescibacteria group bacterium]|nr:3-oxoacyl-ACP reductase FabG [Patescibacteria group bacterium]MBU1683198.1 3-oxoacyl-ACP reductase FabG [Patescibacteria group bacterium]
MGRLEGKFAIVTGAGGGIGEAIAKRFASEGARVAVQDVNEETAMRVAMDIGDDKDPAIYVVGDVSSKADCQRMVGEVMEAFGRIDILVNNAGITRDSSVKKMTEEAWDLVLDVNLKGSFLMTQVVLLHMGEGGRIISTSSIGADGNFGQANYAAAKAGIVGMTRTLALECARKKITVNCVSPGATNTAMLQGVPDKVMEFMLSRIPLGRVADPSEIAAVHAFLASDDASYITGQNIFVDGGALIGI